MLKITALASSSAGNCYVLDNGHIRLMIECGIPWRQIKEKLNFDLSGISGVLVTHEHMDHARAVKDAAWAGLDIYMSAGTAETLGVTGHRIHHIYSEIGVVIGDTWDILPFSVVHDAAEPLGFLIHTGADRIFFITDSAYSEYQVEGITHLMIEANFSNEILDRNTKLGLIDTAIRKRLVKSHFSLDRVKDFIISNDMSKLKEVWILHLSLHNSDADRFKEEIQKLTGMPVYVA